jgi:hypothetical protein
LQEEQRQRREQVYQATKDYLYSISKPFGFDSREKAKTLLRRHSYADGDRVQTTMLFKANAMPDFYAKKDELDEQ